MDPVRFDSLSKSLSTIGTRRGLVRVLLGVPLAGSLAGLLESEEAGAKRPLDRVRDRANRKQEKRHNNGNSANNGNGNKGNGNGGKGGGKKGGGGDVCPGLAAFCCQVTDEFFGEFTDLKCSVTAITEQACFEFRGGGAGGHFLLPAGPGQGFTCEHPTCQLQDC